MDPVAGSNQVCLLTIGACTRQPVSTVSEFTFRREYSQVVTKITCPGSAIGGNICCDVQRGSHTYRPAVHHIKTNPVAASDLLPA